MKILIAVAVLFTYGLQFFVPLEIMWNSIKPMFSHKYEIIGETIMRIFMVMVTGNVSSVIRMRRSRWSQTRASSYGRKFVQWSKSNGHRMFKETRHVLFVSRIRACIIAKNSCYFPIISFLAVRFRPSLRDIGLSSRSMILTEVARFSGWDGSFLFPADGILAIARRRNRY